MTNPQDLVISTELYDTFKNDDYETGVVTIPGSASVAAGGINIYTTDILVGTSGAGVDIRVTAGNEPDRDYIASGIFSASDSPGIAGFIRTGTTSLGSVSYNLFAIAYLLNDGTVRLQVFLPNPLGALAMNGQSAAEDFTYKVRTYKAPFQ